MRTSISRTLQNIGYANLLWNKVEMLWYLYFTGLLGDLDRSQVDAIYRSHETGHRKRLLIVSVANEKFAADSADLAQLRALINRTTEVSKKRNALMHANFALSLSNGESDLIIGSNGDSSKPSRFAPAPLDRELSEYLAALKVLIKDVEFFLDGPPPEQLHPRPENFPSVLTTVRFVDAIDQILAIEETRRSK